MIPIISISNPKSINVTVKLYSKLVMAKTPIDKIAENP
jgi:hypothetical protein